jgi:4-amino-4-deoxy-L-arabinose transferase-like glycosyltransferase
MSSSTTDPRPATRLTNRREMRPSAGRLRALVRRIPRAAWACMGVAILNAVAWSLVTAPFQVPDEAWHYSYIEYVAEHGRPPTPTPPVLSPSLEAVVTDLGTRQVIEAPENGSIWTRTEREQLQRDLEQIRDRHGNGGWYQDVPEPPLFYTLQALPFTAAKSANVLDRLQLMRFVSALLAGVTVLCVFLFLREALPAHPWTWTVGALGLAFLPLFAEMGGGINPDILLYAIVAAVFLLFARIFRRGLTARRAAAMGGLLALGFATKMNFIGEMPGIALGLLAAAFREERALRLRTLRLPALALAVALVPSVVLIALNLLVWDRRLFDSGIYTTAEIHPSLPQALQYAWEFYVIRLPGMEPMIGYFAVRDAWLRLLIGGFGWFDTHFAAWVYNVALVPIVLVVSLCVTTLVRRRAALRARWLELAVYATLAGGVMGMVAAAGYNLYLQRAGGAVEARYLLPLVPLYAGMLALAARGAGRRLMPVVGTAIVVLAIAHNAFGLLLEIARYYA